MAEQRICPHCEQVIDEDQVLFRKFQKTEAAKKLSLRQDIAALILLAALITISALGYFSLITTDAMVYVVFAMAIALWVYLALTLNKRNRAFKEFKAQQK